MNTPATVRWDAESHPERRTNPHRAQDELDPWSWSILVDSSFAWQQLSALGGLAHGSAAARPASRAMAESMCATDRPRDPVAQSYDLELCKARRRDLEAVERARANSARAGFALRAALCSRLSLRCKALS